MTTRLNLETIRSFNLNERTYKPDWDDTAIDFTLPSGITLTTLTQCNDCTTEADSLEGLDGYIYLKTKEDLDFFVSKRYDEIIDFVASNNPSFDRRKY